VATVRAAVYTVSTTPREALLGQDVVAQLTCHAIEDERDAPTFEHGSLVLRLSRDGDPGEASHYLPNVSAVQAHGRLTRFVPMGAKEDLRAGESRERTFSLLEVFPRILGIGDYSFSYRLETQAGAEPAEAAEFRVSAAPACIPYLVALAASDSSIRHRAAALLRKLTGQIYESPESVGQWWRDFGQTLPWKAAASDTGAFALPSQKLGAEVKQRLLDALKNPHSLHRGLELPPQPFVFEPDSEVTEAICKAAVQLSDEPNLGAVEALCRLAAKYPETSIIPALRALEPASSLVLEWLDPTKVPAAL
jgi:hypothetical protein